MFTSGVRPLFKNVACFLSRSLMFFIVDALKIGKRNSIERALTGYFTECYPFSQASSELFPNVSFLLLITF